ncbi:class I SAM-dependent methyltransferase [Pseudodesulfovibrio sp.]|uniref:class I SAM-dependent methyltransferase n=1 Tax=unclassified Pseudodesulfovibrio TaxID=2661612 RepID=UPI003B009AC2
MTTAFERYLASPAGEAMARKWAYMPLTQEVPCPLCGARSHTLWYSLGQGRAVRCARCGMKYVSPRLSEEQLGEYYAAMYTDPLFRKDFEGREHDFFGDPEERRKKIRDRHVEIELTDAFAPKGRVLDIGSGSGLYFEGLAPGKELHGVECSPDAAEFTRQRFNAEITTRDMMESEFPENYFDVINMTYLVEHLIRPQQAIEKVVRWLRPGGMLLVSSPNWDGPAARIFRETFRLNDPCQHINLWGPRTLSSLLLEAGLPRPKIHRPYFKTEYFNRYEVMRLLRNSLLRLCLPALTALGINPQPDKILSPPCWGSIIVLETYKELCHV